LALYDFSEPDGALIRDRSSGGHALDLRIADPSAVRRSKHGLEVAGSTLIRSEVPADRLIESIRQSSAITLEAWVRPAKADQAGPARIVTLSRNPNERNFTLGQDGDKFDVRVRTTGTDSNGMPSVAAKPKSLSTELTHVVFTRDREGAARVYINGSPNQEQTVKGETSNWNSGFHLALANELTTDRPWLGTYRLVAIYDRDLNPAEVEQNYQAGHAASAPSPSPSSGDAKAFETQVAPLLAKHCLECHDTHTQKGRLDLSRKAAALAGGEGGVVIVPGKSAESRLWQLVDADEMPQDRAPLAATEKKVLRQWLDGSAQWSLDLIDPAVYLYGDGAKKHFVQRLTVPEYIESVRSALGVDIAKEARETMPRDLRADGFSNTAYNLNVDLAHIEAHAKLAEIIAGRLDIKAIAGKYTKSRELTDENLTTIIEPVGRLVLRGPLSKEEIAMYCGISTTVAGSGGNFDEAIRYVVEAMLQSPRFVYRVERQSGDGAARPAGQYEVASRLSYILWGGPPDEELLKAADKKALDRAGVERQAQRMLKDSRAVRRSRQFAAEWLDLDRLSNLRPHEAKYPNWSAELAGDMRGETLAFFEEIVWTQKRPMSELLNARVTFATPRLAKHYGLPLEDSPDGDEPIRYDLSKVPGRGGLLTQGSVLTVGGDDASMVTRGLFVMHELLRGVVHNPPPCVDTTPVPSKPGLTQRIISETRIADQKCAVCHSRFEPLAFGLEKFDGLGTFRETDEHGNKLREDGEFVAPGQQKATTYKSTAELIDLLAGSERVRATITWKVTQFALGRPLGAEDARFVEDIHRTAEKRGGTYTSLMTAIVTSDLVLLTRTEPK
jgi:hypothetical protein